MDYEGTLHEHISKKQAKCSNERYMSICHCNKIIRALIHSCVKVLEKPTSPYIHQCTLIHTT